MGFCEFVVAFGVLEDGFNLFRSSHEYTVDYLISKRVDSDQDFKQVKKEINKLNQRRRKLKMSGKYSKEIKAEIKDIQSQIKERNRDLSNIRNEIIYSIFDASEVIFSTQVSCMDTRLERWMTRCSSFQQRGPNQVSDQESKKLKN